MTCARERVAARNPVLQQLFPKGEASAGSAIKAKNASSVARRFVNDLAGMMRTLAASTAHFVRCLKPNAQLRPRAFDPRRRPRHATDAHHLADPLARFILRR